MKVLIDTNVILDVLVGREEFLENSAAVLRRCGSQFTGLVLTSQTTDIFYLLRRHGKDLEAAKEVLRKLVDNLKLVDVIAADVKTALASDIPDYEDALLVYCGKRQKVDFIISRNEKNFRQSPIPAMTPQAFLERGYD